MENADKPGHERQISGLSSGLWGSNFHEESLWRFCLYVGGSRGRNRKLANLQSEELILVEIVYHVCCRALTGNVVPVQT